MTSPRGIAASWLLLIATMAANAAPAPSTNPALDVAAYFLGACPTALSESTFRKYFASVGASIKDVRQQGNSISVGASFTDRPIIGTYFRSPFKCCVSFLGTKADRENFIGWMMQKLSLKDPRLVQESERRMLLFAPSYSNRAITINWDDDRAGDRELLNLCRSDYPNVSAVYRNLPAAR